MSVDASAYICGFKLSQEEHHFSGLIQAAMRQADNTGKIEEYLRPLQTAFPEIWEELHEGMHTINLEGDLELEAVEAPE